MTDIAAKSLLPVQAKALADDEFEAWAKGREPWRLLAIPFGGPIPDPRSPRGVDLDGQWFSEQTDIYGRYDALRKSRHRLVDFHHSAVPSGEDYDQLMRGAVLAKAVLDEEPDEFGWWVDMWARAGERRLDLIRRLRDRGVALFGSAQPLGAGRAKANGEIVEYPWLFVTLSPSPQNTYAVLRPKAVLDEITANQMRINSALVGLLTELDARGVELPQSLALPGHGLATPGDVAVKAGRVLSARNEQALRDALDRLQKVLDQVKSAATAEEDTEA